MLGRHYVLDADVSLKTHIVFDQNSRVRVHDDGRSVSIALKDRALVISPDTVRVLPQYVKILPDSLKNSLIMPQSTTVVSPKRVLYRLVSADDPIDTVINNEEAKLYRSFRNYLADVNTPETGTTSFSHVPDPQRTFGFWAATDTSWISIPYIDADSPPTFRFSGNDTDIPSSYFPASPSLCDARADTIYCCSPTEGWIRLTANGTILHLPLPAIADDQSELVRCVTTIGSVLLTYHTPSGTLRSVLVSPIGTRLSPVFTHKSTTILAPVSVSGVLCIEQYNRTPTQLQRSLI